MTNPLLLPLGVLLLFAMFIGAAALGRWAEVRRRRRRRVVEQPNSHHTWQRVQEIAARERWQDMPLDRIHEVNRVEVERLLAKVRTWGGDALRPQERRFLDQMADLAGVPPVSDVRTLERPATPAGAADLLHRPA